MRHDEAGAYLDATAQLANASRDDLLGIIV